MREVEYRRLLKYVRYWLVALRKRGMNKDDGRSIVQLEDEETLHAFFADLSAEPEKPEAAATSTTEAPPTAAPSEVTVEVFNGSGTRGLAGTDGQVDVLLVFAEYLVALHLIDEQQAAEAFVPPDDVAAIADHPHADIVGGSPFVD